MQFLRPLKYSNDYTGCQNLNIQSSESNRKYNFKKSVVNIVTKTLRYKVIDKKPQNNALNFQ